MVYICAVSGCAASTQKYGRYGWMEGVKFFTFPKHDQAKTRRWIQLCRRKGKVGSKENIVDSFKIDKYSRICSRHFSNFTPDGYPIGDPTLFPWNNWGAPSTARNTNAVQKLHTARQVTPAPPPEPQDPSVLIIAEEMIQVGGQVTVDHTSEESLVGAMRELQLEVEDDPVCTPPPKLFHDYCIPTVLDPPAEKCDAQVMTEESMEDIAELRSKVPNKPGQYFMDKVLRDDNSVQHYTGFPSRKILEATYEVFDFGVPYLAYWKGPKKTQTPGKKDKKRRGPSRKLDPFYEFCLTMMKMRRDYSDKTLGDWFDISESSVSSIILTWLNYLDQVMVPVLLFWPDRKTIRQTMPQQFRRWYPRTRTVIDAAEFPIQRFRNPTAQHMTYSQYKSTNTLKALIGIAPNGPNIFVSDMYSGNISDKYLTQISGFLELLEEGDEVMADRGFKIHDLLLMRGCSLVIPPFTRKPGRYSKARRLNANEIRTTRRIANLRIHVERAIRRIKAWKILYNRLPAVSKATASQMLRVVAALCNLMGKLF